jgi:hypothetical protein
VDADGTQHHTLRFGVARLIWLRGKALRPEVIREWSFTSEDGFWHELLTLSDRKWAIYVVAHNWQFDAAMIELDKAFTRYGLVVCRFNIKDRRFIVDLRVGKLLLKFRDSYQYVPMPLDAIGQYVGLPKLPMPSEDAPFEMWLAYCKRDVDVLQSIMLSYVYFVQQNDLGNFAATTPAQAFAAFRHRFMTHDIFIHDDEDALDLERRAYHGGRCETFFYGKVNQPLYKLDVNSMYPAVMRDNRYPTAKATRYSHLSVDRLCEIVRDYLVVAQCRVLTNEAAYPLMQDGKLLFPVGEFWTYLSTPEVTYALSKGHIQEVGETVVYCGAPIFTEYVKSLYAMRQAYKAQGNQPFQLLCKLLLNGLYGKFGEKFQDIVDKGRTDAQIPEFVEFAYQERPGERPHRAFILAGHLYVYENEREGMHSAPAIAAHVTAYARMKLHDYIVRAGREHCFYVDTDSLIVDEEGYRRLASEIDPGALGKLKLEETADCAEFYAPKDYVFGEVQKIKGIRHDAVQIQDSLYCQEQFSKWLTLVRRGVAGEIVIHQQTKQLRRVPDKGIVDATGRIWPLQVSLAG